MIDKLPKIVAEIGINHNGDADLANDIAAIFLTAAKQTGYPLDNIFFKFQKRCPEVSVPKHMWDMERISPLTGDRVRYIDYKKQIELEYDDYLTFGWLFEECGGWFVSAWDEPSVWFVKDNFPELPYIKIPSAHLTNKTLLKLASITDAELILSTGMSTRNEVNDSVDAALRYSDGRRITVLSCTATYPCPDEEINFFKLSGIQKLSEESGNKINHGFSSHSVSPFPAIYSNFFDVDMIEVHVTKDRTLPGSDHSASLEYSGFVLLLRETLRISKLYGHGTYIYESELQKRKTLRGY